MWTKWMSMLLWDELTVVVHMYTFCACIHNLSVIWNDGKMNVCRGLGRMRRGKLSANFLLHDVWCLMCVYVCVFCCCWCLLWHATIVIERTNVLFAFIVTVFHTHTRTRPLNIEGAKANTEKAKKRNLAQRNRVHRIKGPIDCVMKNEMNIIIEKKLMEICRDTVLNVGAWIHINNEWTCCHPKQINYFIEITRKTVYNMH